ncbi:MAG: AAA family ATPase, partial [Nitrospira sp.]|nr:AAA family ATPase [Nitrospira sp.]
PDKAIDVVDEAAARLRTEIDSLPAELDEISRKVLQLEIEREALKKEKDPASAARLATLESELDEKQRGLQALKTRWESEKASVSRLRKMREAIEEVKRNIEQAERAYDLNRVAELRYGELPRLERELGIEQQQLGKKQDESRLLKEEVDEDEIAAVVGRWTGIPVSRLLEGETEKLLKLEDLLHQRVVGQDEGVRAVADAVLRARSGIKDPNRPIGSFLFLGPTGVGKTELARALATVLFDDESNLVRVDMSEYMEKHTVARLIGAPPGYIGYEEGGQLTEAVRRRPFSVILFDEIEKAHHDVFNVLLQVLDDGRLTDSQGRTVDFKNTVLIMTSNIGSPHILEAQQQGASYEQMRTVVMGELQHHFRPEFLNRVDEAVVFHPLGAEHLVKIVEIQLERLRRRLDERRITLAPTSAALRHLGERGYDPVYGARPLKRLIQQDVETPIARLLVRGELRDGDTATVDVKNGSVIVIPTVTDGGAPPSR